MSPPARGVVTSEQAISLSIGAQGDGWSSLFEAARNGAPSDVIAALVRNGVDPTSRAEDGSTAAHTAATYGHAAVLSALLRVAPALARARAGRKQSTLLHLAAEHSDAERSALMVEVVLGSAGEGAAAAVDADGMTAMHRAAVRGNKRALRLLLSAPGAPAVDVAAHGEHAGSTALHCAAIGGHPACARVLLDSGANVQSRDEVGSHAFTHERCPCRHFRPCDPGLGCAHFLGLTSSALPCGAMTPWPASRPRTGRVVAASLRRYGVEGRHRGMHPAAACTGRRS